MVIKINNYILSREPRSSSRYMLLVLDLGHRYYCSNYRISLLALERLKSRYPNNEVWLMHYDGFPISLMSCL
jgi:hypothetical protein